MGCYFGGGGVSRQGQHPLFAAFPGRTARERKREASEIPEWIDRCYVIGAASSTPQEARSREREAVQQQGPPSSLSSSQKPGKWPFGRVSAPSNIWAGGGRGSPKISQGALTFLLCPLANGGGYNHLRKERLIKDLRGDQKG